MNHNHYLIRAAAALTLLIGSQAMAQDAVDLSSQRSEIQSFRRVPGEKIDHQGIVINPTPQSMSIDRANTLDVADGFNVKTDDASLLTLPWLKVNKKGAKLNVNIGPKGAAKNGVEPKSGAYKLVVDKKGVVIDAFDAAGAFYAMQTLHQLLSSEFAAEGTRLPYITVNDYPDLGYRGVVEGFYGTPWSHEVRLSLIDFYGANKMNNYLYGPKDDPYHSSPNWRQPYPEAEANNIRELVEACKRNHVDFIWAIHPGGDIRWNEADYDSLVAKFDMMYDLGVRAFAIFFDDIEGEGARSDKQVDLLNRLNNDFIKAKGDVANLIMCPTDYTKLWANPGPNGQLAYYGNHLDPSIEVFYTGDVVCSDLTPETMEFVNSRIKRPALFWWNFPVSDYCRNYILQGPVYGLDTSLTANEVIGFESNPMEHGEASKLALYGVADYAWNMADYNPIDNWERGLQLLMPEAADAYRTFAIHSADTETGYRRDESWETVTFPYDNYTPAQFEALQQEFERVAAAPQIIFDNATNDLLIGELRPWLVEFGKLGQRGLRTLDLIKVYEQGNNADFWQKYLLNLMSEQDREDYNAHKSGTMKLQPFYDNAMDGMLKDFYTKLSGNVPTSYTAVGSYRNIKTTLPKLMLDNDTSTYYTSAASQSTGQWVGLDLGKVREVETIDILQGRNSIDDVDYYDNVVLEASANGTDWTELTPALEKTYVIRWAGQPIDARYVRIRKLPSEKRNYVAVREFNVNAPTQERIGLNVSGDAVDEALLIFDENPFTTYTLDGSISFDRPQGETLTILAANAPTYTVEQLDAAGNVIATASVSTPYVDINTLPEAARIRLSGNAVIFEAIAR